jgi:peroxiredoxin
MLIVIAASRPMVIAMILLGVCYPLHAASKQTINSRFRGKPAPEFHLKDLSGKAVNLSDFRGKAVVLNFWATWCESCRAEMPWFVELQKQYGPEGLAVIGIAMDENATPEQIGDFARKMGVNYTILQGNDAVARQYGNIEFLPVTYYVSRDGLLVERSLGTSEPMEILLNVKRALAQPGTKASR